MELGLVRRLARCSGQSIVGLQGITGMALGEVKFSLMCQMTAALFGGGGDIQFILLSAAHPCEKYNTCYQ